MSASQRALLYNRRDPVGGPLPHRRIPLPTPKGVLKAVHDAPRPPRLSQRREPPQISFGTNFHERYDPKGTDKRKKNGYAHDDIYTEHFDEIQGRLSLFRPIKSEYLSLPNDYPKYSSLHRNFNNDEYRSPERRRKDFYDFRIGNDRRIERSGPVGRNNETPLRNPGNSRNNEIKCHTGNYGRTIESHEKHHRNRIEHHSNAPMRATQKQKQICKPLRLAESEKLRYWTTDALTKTENRKPDGEPKKNVTFSEVSGCSRKTVIHDPVCGRKVIPVRELEVSLDQMIQNGYFEKHNIRIHQNDIEKLVGSTFVATNDVANGYCGGKRGNIANGKCENGMGTTRETLEQNISKRPKHLSQVIAALAVSLAPFSAGLGKGYSSPAIASLQGERGPNSTRREFSLSDQQASWVASLSLLGALFGGMVGGAAMRHGRRRVLLLAALPFSLSWLLTVMATSVEMMFITSFIGGFCCSIVTMVSQVYISEISVPDIRGCLSAVLKIVGHLGVLMSFTIGAYLDWQQLAMFISVAPVILFCTVIYIPETPSYLVLNGKDEEAYKSLLWLRGPGCDVVQELATLRTNVLASKNFNTRQSQLTGGQLLNAITVNRLIGPILVTCGLMMFQRFSGVHAFNFYAVPIFRQTFGGMNPHGAAIAVSFVQLLASCISGLLIDTVGRLPLLIISSVFMSMALAGFGSYAYYEEVHRNQRIQNVMFHQPLGQNDWIPLLCVLVFTIAFSLGMSPISWLLIGELFPLEYRGMGSAMATAFSYLCAFVSVKTFVDFQQALGLHGAFWLYASISVGGLCFVVCCVPETKGKDLDEMDPRYVQTLSQNR